MGMPAKTTEVSLALLDIEWLKGCESVSSDQSKSFDLLGVKPIAEAVNKLTGAAVDGSAAFLSRICLPAAEEFGLLLRDRVHAWRAANIAAITQKAEENLKRENASKNVHAHPRLVGHILDEGSWIEDPIVQDFWAGLLSSSCTDTGDDDSNLIFVDLLASLTKLQARILDFSCKNVQKRASLNGLIQANELTIESEVLIGITGEHDIQRLDRELDHLRERGLIQHGFDSVSHSADITPSGLALHLYVRCQGSRVSPIQFFKLEQPEASDQSANNQNATATTAQP